MPEKKTPPGQDKKKQQSTKPPQQQKPTSPTPTPTPWPDARPAPPPPAPPVYNEECPRAKLQFLPGWQQRQHGEVRAGGKLVIEFDPSRLPQCRQSTHGAQVWDIDVGMIFHPGRQRFEGSVMRKVRMPNGGPITGLEPQAFEVTVPADAERVEMWFRNYYTLGAGCESWDSRYCQNYWFMVARQ